MASQTASPSAAETHRGSGSASSAVLPADSGSERSVTAWERFSFGLIHLFTRGLLLLLGLRGLYAFGRWFGFLEWVINYKRRRRFAQSYAEVLGRHPTSTERRSTTLEHFQRTRCDKLFYMILDCLSPARAAGLFGIENRHLLDEAMARERGAYVALSHHGPHHVTAMLMCLLGYKVAGVRDRREGGLRRYMHERFAQRFPQYAQLRMMYADTYPRDIYRCYQEGYVLGSAMDVTRVRLPHQRYEEVECFGEVRPFLSGPMRIALRNGTPVIQGFMISEPGFHYRLVLTESLIDPDRVEDEDAAVAEAMKTYAANVEAYVRATPALITRT
ncbi:MAG: hypothetical protein J5J06_11370 [Phycisphaerae bacterium]|nr:hypothetical protein [Phycisphaerae bacterium]